ncbi:MAG TPA: phosphoribosylaminoimidazolesuccinocarboxamide synthase, partial [bacterium]
KVFEKYGFEEGKELNYPITEFFLKDKERQDPMINQTHIIAFNLATMDETRMIERMTSKINAILKSFFLRRNMILVDFTVEYGRFKNKILLADEISPDTCHLWDASLARQHKEDGSVNLAEFEIDAGEIKNRIVK